MRILPESTLGREQGRPIGAGAAGAALFPAGPMVSVTRLVPLSALTTTAGRISLAKLRDLVSGIKARYHELGESTLGDLELHRRGGEVELKMYFLTGAGRAGAPERGRE